MSWTVEITRIGDGLGFVFPSEAVERLKLRAGMKLRLTDAGEGVLRLRVEETEAQLAVMDDLMNRHAGALRKLADEQRATVPNARRSSPRQRPREAPIDET